MRRGLFAVICVLVFNVQVVNCMSSGSTETVNQSSDEKQNQVLHEHFGFMYFALADRQFVPNASFETAKGIWRCLSGIPSPCHNVVFGVPEDDHWDACIHEQLTYFGKANMPFVWYLDEESSPEFKKRLLDHGFLDKGIFHGVIGTLDESISAPEISNDYVLELVTNPASMDEFNELVCSVFDIQGMSKDMYREVLWDMTQMDSPTMYHWIAKKQGKVVSAISTFIDGEVVSFWNGASLPEVRRQGINTALRRVALKDAVARGCRTGTSYLMSEGLAFGICNKLGYQTKWRFHAFICPPAETRPLRAGYFQNTDWQECEGPCQPGTIPGLKAWVHSS